MNGPWRGSAALPGFLRLGGLRDLQALIQRVVPEVDRVLVVAVNDARDRVTELVLFAGELDTVLGARHFFAVDVDAREAAHRALHEVGQRRPEQIGAGTGDAGVRLERVAHYVEGAAETLLRTILGITLVRHELRRRRAHVVLDVL